MAEENSNNSNNSDKNGENSTNDDFSNNNEDIEEAVQGPHFHGNEPDIGLGDTHPRSYSRNLNNNETKFSRKEDTLVSFKHFLNSSLNTRSNTRPCPDIFNSVCKNNTTNVDSGSFSDHGAVTSDISSVLPDFVQDHLAMEQHYFNRNEFPSYRISNVISNVSHDSSINRGEQLHSEIPINPSSSVVKQNINHCSSRLGDNSNPSTRYVSDNVGVNNATSPYENENFSSSVSESVRGVRVNPLDLPVNGNYHNSRCEGVLATGQSLAFDLTRGNNLIINSHNNNCITSPSHSRSNISRMPDFLADSHIYRTSRHSRQSSTTDDVNSELSPTIEISRLENENTRLRQMINNLQGLFADQSIRLKQTEDELRRSRANGKICSMCNRGINNDTADASYPCPSTSGTSRHDASITLERDSDNALELIEQLRDTLSNMKILSHNLNSRLDDSYPKPIDDSDNSD